jgi:hypothetical protein
MNSLNSVLIEGDVAELAEGGGVVLFIISVDTSAGAVFVTIRASGRLGQACAENLKIGRGVRVVGRLEAGEAGLRVYAEHVEFKPPQKQPKPASPSDIARREELAEMAEEYAETHDLD